MTILVALLLLNLIIFLHEVGHLVTARLLDVEVDEFAVGIGPVVAAGTVPGGRPFGGVRFALRLLPVGGFVRMAHQRLDDGDTPAPPAPPSPGRHVFVSVAGPAASVAGMALLFLVAHLLWGVPPRPEVDGFTRADARSFEPSFAVAVQATGNPAIVLERDASGGRDVPIASPMAPWVPLAGGEAVARSVRATRQAVGLVGEMMWWIVRHPGAFSKHIGSPLGIVDDGRKLAAASTPTPEPSRLARGPDRPAAAPYARTEAGDAPEGADPDGVTAAMPGPAKPAPAAARSEVAPGEPPAADADGETPPGAETDDRTNAPGERAPRHVTREPAPPPSPSWADRLASTRGYALVLFYMGLVSVFIAHLNLLPIPPFDGFQAIVSAGEAITGRNLPHRARLALTVVGLVLVLGILGRGVANDLSGPERPRAEETRPG